MNTSNEGKSAQMLVGSGPSTGEKWLRLEHLLRVHAGKCREIMVRRNLDTYCYLDFYAGPGIYDVNDDPRYAGLPGSPVRAIAILDAMGIPYRAFLFDPRMAGRLRANFCPVDPSRIIIGDEKCDRAVDGLVASGVRLRIGLAFFDPNGKPDWPSIGRFAKAFPWMDILINVHSSVIKRMINPVHRGSRLSEYLKSIGKKCIYLWDVCPGDWNGFSLVFLTNYRKFPEFRDLGFYRADSPKGQCVKRQLDYSRKERKESGGVTGFLHFEGGEHVY